MRCVVVSNKKRKFLAKKKLPTFLLPGKVKGFFTKKKYKEVELLN